MRQTDFKVLYREVVYLIEQGVLSVEDADNAVSWGPGLRWGVMGPNLRGISVAVKAGFAISWNTSWTHSLPMKALGNPELTTELKQTITEGVLHEVGNRSVKQLAQEENEMLLGLLSLRAKHATASTVGEEGGET